MKIAPWSLIIIITIRKVRDAVCSWCPAVCPVLSSSAGSEGEMLSCFSLNPEHRSHSAGNTATCDSGKLLKLMKGLANKSSALAQALCAKLL